MNPDTIDGATVHQMDKDHVIHPYTDFTTFHEEGSQVITGSEGVYIIDSDNKRYLDGIAGLWCVNIGHGRKEMADAISKQILTMQYYNPFGHTTNVPASVLAAKLASLAPGQVNHVFYSCGGSTANDTAIRLVHYYNNLRGMPDKKKIISRNYAYHGSTYVAANLTGIHGTKTGFDRICDDMIHHVSAADMYHRPRGAESLSESEYLNFLADEFENRVLQLGPDNVAAFIAEPIMGAGGVLVAPEGYHQRMYRICKQYDMLYIADEVVTAFGRLGQWFVSEDIYGVQPDIICIAKGLTSGYIPLGATLLSDDIYEVISQPQCDGGTLSMGYTYTAHPVACAAALKNIEIMESEYLLEHVREVGPYFFEQLQCLAEFDIVGDIRGSHLMVGIELVQDKGRKQSFAGEVNVTSRLFKHCLERGLVVRPVGDVVVLSPPLIMSKEQIDSLVNILRESIDSLSAQLREEGFLPASTLNGVGRLLES
ncbi:MAG: putrescine aminotransferase [Halieaceae bacterium]|jgi:putrescine aminotransferase